MSKTKKIIFIASAAGVLLAAILIFWSAKISPTRIAFVNYQITTLGQISKSNNSRFIKIREVGLDELNTLGKYDMVMINAMGLRISEEQRQQIEEASLSTAILSTAVTNPANYIVSVDSLTADTLTRYLNNGSRKNYRSMLNYIRRYVDGKICFVEEPEPVVPASHELFYHSDPNNPDEELGFNTLKDYETFLKNNGLYKNESPRIVLSGLMGEPTELVAALEKSGNQVYPIRDANTFITNGQADSVLPAAWINMAHGRMGDGVVAYLTHQNIPLFTTVYVPQLTEKWEEDKMGMSGGFLSQSVVTPEIDGAIRPYALFAHRINKEGLQEMYAVPERLADFVETVNRYIALKTTANADKHIVIFYYKGPGQNALTASGLEVAPSLYAVLLRLREAGYKVTGLPNSADALAEMIQKQGAVLGTYAEGAFDEFMKNGNPEFITKKQYEEWILKTLRPALYDDVKQNFGEFPGSYMSTSDGKLAVSRIQFGNVVLMPQPMAGLGDNDFKIVHGTDVAPPHPYIAAYLWARYSFKADAFIHFGTHGSLEYTPRKQVALCSNDWPDRLIGTVPHFYLYTIGNVGESLIAKRRSYATIISYLTPPFKESNARNSYRELTEAIKTYYHVSENQSNTEKIKNASLQVKKLAVQMGIHRSLELDSVMSKPYSEDEITRIENFAEEIATEKMTGRPYILGQPYEKQAIESSVYAMATEPIAYSLLALDKSRGKAADDAEKHKMTFTSKYLTPARQLVARLLSNPALATDKLVCQTAGITEEELDKAREIAAMQVPMDMMLMMREMAREMPGTANIPAQHPRTDASNSKMKVFMRKMGSKVSPEKALKMAKMMGADEEALAKMKAAMEQKKSAPQTSAETMPEKEQLYTQEEIDWAMAVTSVERTILNVCKYMNLLSESPEYEMRSLLNALSGGFVAPSPGGDPIANPNALPTGRNLYGINAENTPSESAWEKGKMLADNTIAMYRKNHNDSIPRKVSYTLWSGEFIETEGATIAQVLYMLGVEPVRDVFGRVTDLRLIPTKELGRPRIDVVVQTSGQLRDIAASRLFLINRAVNMAAGAKDDEYENFVAQSIVEAERVLVDKGIAPKTAREIAHHRVFGGVNGGYGTGIQSMVQAGDRWESEQEIADVYLNNMGAFYGDETQWESVQQYAFEAALTGTDAVIQPRQSNTWGALSLDHVYEFMGGLNLAVRNVTGKEPDAYLSDYRNHNHMHIQELKEAIGVESRTTLLNPNYIDEMMKGGASSAGKFAELVQNTYGWNVMKPKAIDNEMWDEIYEVYVKDKYNLQVHNFFETQNPAALQEMTAVMMETARKGMWQATEQQLADIAELHTRLVNQYDAACSGTVCDNAKLRQYIASKVDPQTAAQYQKQIQKARQPQTSDNNSQSNVVMKKEELSQAEKTKHIISNVAVAVIVVAVLSIIVAMVIRRRKTDNE